MPFDFDAAVSAPFRMQPGLRRIAIHVDVQPLATALNERARRQRVHDALASMSDAVLQYRGLGAVRDRLLQWLSARSA